MYAIFYNFGWERYTWADNMLELRSTSSCKLFVGEAPKPTLTTVAVLETVRRRKLPVLWVLGCESLPVDPVPSCRLNESCVLCRNTRTTELRLPQAHQSPAQLVTLFFIFTETISVLWFCPSHVLKLDVFVHFLEFNFLHLTEKPTNTSF
jgi:hypothetical protein